ncbi:PREDICTED: alpha-amylase A [Dinoponera quadriceps]|uniref:Alpha-amylase n=1 Tax=Dinoponera quadriceps TaxID=609295 RepID=A0A6P3XUX3_DINQU|nr:PREDICTED: alpha-amylase A [Dinoponera quadriceps]
MQAIVCALLLALLSAAAAYHDPLYVPGHNVIVHLFEWKWLDIAKECEEFLGPIGYGGVQVSPIQENVIIPSRPWWERYQPMSYKFETRSGTKAQFKEMVARCNRAGVRVYVDAVFNHMTGDFEPALGTGGSTADTRNRLYYNVPYSSQDFHNPPCNVNNYNDPVNVRNCELVGLHDLNQTSENVRDTIIDFLNMAIDIGIAGFRIDAAKHMWPNDLKAIYDNLQNVNQEHNFWPNSRPYIYQEVIDYDNEAISRYEYTDLAAVTEFLHGHELSKAFKGNNMLKWFVSWGTEWNLMKSKDALVFVDNHDTQRNNNNILNFKTSRPYKMAVAFMLAHNYGNPRVMSSFSFENFNQGPPSDNNGNILSPIIHPDNTCGNGWICEHRWRQIYNMVIFRNAVNGTTVDHWWDNGGNQIAFCRGERGFVAFNNEKFDLRASLFTCLESGLYCDVISGDLVNGKCTGKTIRVNESRYADVEIRTSDEDGVIATHHKMKIPGTS